MYWDIEESLRSVIEPIVVDHRLEMVDACLRTGRGRGLLRIVVDTPRGDGRVTVDECARVSREVSRSLDVSDLIPGAYMLEVCSPGVDRTLGRAIDFERAVGARVSVETRQPLAGRSRFKGELVEFAEGELHLRVGSELLHIPLGAVARANAVHGPGDGARSKR